MPALSERRPSPRVRRRRARTAGSARRGELANTGKVVRRGGGGGWWAEAVGGGGDSPPISKSKVLRVVNDRAEGAVCSAAGAVPSPDQATSASLVAAAASAGTGAPLGWSEAAAPWTRHEEEEETPGRSAHAHPGAPTHQPRPPPRAALRFCIGVLRRLARARSPRHTALPPPTLSLPSSPSSQLSTAPLQSLCLLCSPAAVGSPGCHSD